MSRKIRKIAATALAFAMLTGSAAGFSAVQGTPVITVSAAEQAVSATKAANGIAGPTIDAGTYKIAAGDTFKVKIKVTDNADGFNAINAWLDINTNYFEIVDKANGDPDMAEYEDSEAYTAVTLNEYSKKNVGKEIKTLITLYSDTNNLKGDVVISTITLKAKADAPAGYYSLPFDAVGDNGAMANRIDDKRNPIVINPTFKGALVQIGEGTDMIYPSSSASSDTLKGDFNLDGIVSQTDATFMLRYLLESSVSNDKNEVLYNLIKGNIREDLQNESKEKIFELAMANADVDGSEEGKSFKQTDATYVLRAVVTGSKVDNDYWTSFFA
ncbi:MAG: hypothetical protein J5864_00535 [Oscillospiraceae bacterium]|nr:hypothetical protein [Oscillospiraceae bacterium]